MAGIQTQGLNIASFTGGQTDEYIPGKNDMYFRMDNLLLNAEGNPISRPGSQLFDVAHARLGTNIAVNTLINFGFDEALLAHSDRSVYSYSALSGWSEILGPNGNIVFTASSANSNTSLSLWKKHVVMAKDVGQPVMKIYKDQAGNFQVLNASMPAYPDSFSTAAKAVLLTESITLANSLKAAMSAHFSSLTAHPVAQIYGFAPNATDEATLVTLTKNLLNAHKLHTDDARNELLTVYHNTSNKASIFGYFYIDSGVITPFDMRSCITALNALKRVFNFHMAAFEFGKTDTYGHLYGSYTPVLTPDVVVDKTPVITSTIGARIAYSQTGRNLYYDWIEDHKTAYNTHTNTTSGNGSHLTVGHESISETAVDERTFDLVTYKLLMGYIAHWDGPRHKFGAVTTNDPSAPTAAYDYFVGPLWFFINGGSTNPTTSETPLHMRNFTKAEVLNTYINLIQNVWRNNFKAHIEQAVNTRSQHWSTFAGYGCSSGSHTFTSPDTDAVLTWSADSLGRIVSIDVPNSGYGVAEQPGEWIVPGTVNGVITLEWDSGDGILTNAYVKVDGSPITHFSDVFANGIPKLDLGTVSVWEYAFLYRNRYTTFDSIVYEDVGTTAVMGSGAYPQSLTYHPDSLLNHNRDDHFSFDISSLSPIATTQNFPTTTGSIVIYRSLADLTTLYQVADIINTTTTFSDTYIDSEIELNPTIYTTGGELDADPISGAEFVHIVNNYGYYGNVVDPYGNVFAQRIMQSKAGNPFATPGTMFVDLPDKVEGLSSTKSIPVTWTKGATYRLEGEFDSFGRGQLRAVVISDQVGNIAPYSPVQVDGGIVFMSSKGIYYTDAYQVQLITTYGPKTYANLVNTATKTKMIKGTLDRKGNRVWWSIPNSSGDPTQMLILDLNQGIKSNSVFTTASNDSSYTSTALCFFNREMIRGDSLGYVYKHADAYTYDLKPDPLVAVANWQKLPVRIDYRSPAFDFGSLLERKWVTTVVTKCRNHGNLSMQINSINDDGKSIHSLTPIRWRGAPATFGDTSIVSFNDGPTWTNRDLIENKRRFPAGTMRCSNKQIQLTTARVILYNSDTSSLATVNRAGKIATLLTGSWPADLVGRTLLLESDSYTHEFPILSQAGAVLTLDDPGSILPATGVYKWVIKGYPLDEKVQLLSYVIHYAYLGREQRNPVGESGANA